MTTRTAYELLCVATVCAASTAGCGGKAPPKPAAPAPRALTATVTATPAAAPAPAAKSPNLGVDDELSKRCSLRFAQIEQAPKFGYNADELQPSDRDLLQQVAACLVSGPLKGRSVQLVGRADPRGTDEYNLGLGSRRAENVRMYLERLGVPHGRLSPMTRGELDASGTEESGWERDRRVDLQLVN